MTESDIMFYDKTFVETLTTVEKNKKIKYNGTVYYIPKSQDYLYERLQDKNLISVFCNN